MNILVVHETEYIEKVVFEYQIIPELWSSWGHNVYVIDFPTKLDKKSFFDLGSLRTKIIGNIRRSNKKKGITLIRPGFIKLPVISRLTAFFTHFFAIRRALIDYRIDVIFLYSVPTNGLQTVFWARRYKIPIHFRLLDVLHCLVLYKILSRPTFFMEKVVYKRVNELTAITPRLMKYAVKMGAGKKTATYLPSGSDSDLFYPQQKDKKLLKKFGIENDDRILLFAGTLYSFSGLDRVIDYLGRHKKEYSNLKLLILGHGEQSGALQKLVKKYSLSGQVFLTGFIEYGVLPKYINLSDICINPFEINDITDIIFPGKIYQYLACGKPVIATKLAGLVDLFPANKKQNNIFYYNANKIEKFFKLIGHIKITKIQDPNLSLQEIAKVLANRLEKMISNSKTVGRNSGA